MNKHLKCLWKLPLTMLFLIAFFPIALLCVLFAFVIVFPITIIGNLSGCYATGRWAVEEAVEFWIQLPGKLFDKWKNL